jgi:hypothetical protein
MSRGENTEKTRKLNRSYKLFEKCGKFQIFWERHYQVKKLQA